MANRKKKSHDEHENHERWLVSYADFITLLFAFFVVLYATSTKNEDKEKSFEESVRAELKLAVAGRGEKGASGGDSIFGDLMNPLDQFPRRGGPAEIRDYLERQLRRRMTEEERRKFGIQVRHDASGARISFSTESFFPEGSAKLKKSAVDALAVLGGLLAETDKKIAVEGHADGQEASSGGPGPWDLASSRATSVVKYLIKYQKVNPARLTAVSYGDQMPLTSGASERSRSLNRRIDLLVAE